jgi:hypothetical protein
MIKVYTKLVRGWVVDFRVGDVSKEHLFEWRHGRFRHGNRPSTWGVAWLHEEAFWVDEHKTAQIPHEHRAFLGVCMDVRGVGRRREKWLR